MNFLGKICGEKKEGQVHTTGEAIQKLREIEDMLLKGQDFVEKKFNLEMGCAKKNLSKNKSVAIQALKRKKRYRKQLQQIDGILNAIEMQRDALEGANSDTAVLAILQTAEESLKRSHQHLEPDQIYDIINDIIAEQQDCANEILNGINNPIGIDDDMDEDELEKELEELKQELKKELLNVPGTDELPAVPQEEVEEDDEMKKLEAWVP